MQLCSSLATILAGLALFTQAVNSTPLAQRNEQTVTLPLKRLESTNSDVHPQIGLQQHINRGVRRLAVMTGQKPPSQRALEANLARRVESLDAVGTVERRADAKKKGHKKGKKAAKPAAATAGSTSTIATPKVRSVGNEFETLERRYNRHGVPSQLSDAVEPEGLDLAKKAKGDRKTKEAGGKKAAAAAQQNQTNATPDDEDSDVTDANTPTDSDSLGLDIEAQDVGYLASVQLGTPPRNFLVLMDSGSADFWVGAENCQSESGGGCGNHVFLGQESSSTFQDTGKPFQVTYGTGDVKGTIINDNVAIAGLQLNQHTFGVATQESVDFSSDDTPFDGLMGLAQSTLSEQKTPTPVDSLASAGLISAPITSFKISRLADDKNDGEITFGGLDQSKFDPKTLISVPNVNQQGFWEAALDSASVNGADTGLKGRTAILDTGTTLMVLPSSDAATIHQNIPGAKSDGQGGFTVPCTSTASVALTFGGQEFAIDPRDIAVQPVDPNDPKGDCVSGISSGNIGGATEWLVGDVFLKNAYFSVDTSKNTVSLAKLV